jgi:broad specificity phosphatase PhoE
VVSSDLRRTADTAAALAAVTGLDVTHDAGLRETYAGVWQGLTNEEIQARYGEEYRLWRLGEPIRRGGGELNTEVADRAVPVVLDAVKALPDSGTVVVVSHGGTIRMAIGRLLGLDPYHWEALAGLSNCCWSVLGEGARGWRLQEHNAGTLPEPVLGDDN